MEDQVWAKRDVGVGSSKGIGLGWLLALGIGGGLLLFLALGILITWYFKQRLRPCTTRVYSWSGVPDDGNPNGDSLLARAAKSRLKKHRMISSSETELGGSGWSSRLSLSHPVLPPVLPMPRDDSFRGRRRTRSQAREDEIDQDGLRRSWRESLFGFDSWFAKSPTKIDLCILEDGTRPTHQREEHKKLQKTKGPGSAPVTPRASPQKHLKKGSKDSIQQQAQRQQQAQTPTKKKPMARPSEDRIEVQKRDSRALQQQQKQQEKSHGSSGSPEPSTDEDQQLRGRVRVPSQAHVRPGVTDTDLRDILHMTEQRLRDGSSQSPSKTTPRTSPAKRTPVKTPRSHRSVSRTAPASNKKTPVGLGVDNLQQETRNVSATSVCSAANSLLAEAAQELELPGGMSSPSKLKGREWTATEKPIQQPVPAKLKYRKSADSDLSSTLSTLYSAGEPEEQYHQQQQQYQRQRQVRAVHNTGGDDPFVERGDQRNPSWETKQLASDPRTFRRRTGPVSVAEAESSPICSSACPSPLRPISTMEKTNANRDSRVQAGQSLVLQPPETKQSDDVEPKPSTPGYGVQQAQRESGMRQTSESSMESVSVHTEDSEVIDLPMLESSARNLRISGRGDDDSSASSRDTSPSTPVRRPRKVDMSSSPYSEEDILNLLLSSVGPRRALPLPPPRVEGADALGPTQLSPRPRSKARIVTPTMRNASDSSSSYGQTSLAGAEGDDEAGFNPILLAPTHQTPNLTATISELRRMNSVISSYSAASVVSVASSGFGDFDSSVLPILPERRVSHSRSQSRTNLMGKKNYLSIGDHSPKKKTVGQHQRTTSKMSLKANKDDEEELDKENAGLGLKGAIPRHGENGSSESPASGLRDASKQRTRRSPSKSTGLSESSARASPATSRSKEKKRLNQLDELTAKQRRNSTQRLSADSLGLYDKDGFLVGSPERDRCLRM